MKIPDHDSLNPTESCNIEESARVREDDSAVNPWGVQAGPFQPGLEKSDVSRQLSGGVSEMTGIWGAPSARLDLCPDTVSMKDETPVMLGLKHKESRGTDENAVDVGNPPVAVQREVVVGGVIVTQSRREQIGSECLLAPDSAPISRIDGTAHGRDEKGDHDGNEARYKDDSDTCGDSGE